MSASLLARLPDIPRWVIPRFLLASGHGRWHGDEVAGHGIVVDQAGRLGCVIGAPSPTTVREIAASLGSEASLIAPYDIHAVLCDALPHWSIQRAHLHILGGAGSAALASAADRTVRWVDGHDLPHFTLPGALRRELEAGLRAGPLAAAFVGTQPVSFCYAFAVTETLWDVAVDTLAPFRRQGHASRCVAAMIRHQRSQGRRPVWGAADDNPASLAMAECLGFEPVDTLALAEAP